MPDSNTTLIQLFAKPPVEGKVKTRLIPEIGAQSATAIYQHCLQNNISLVQHSAFDYQLWLTEPSNHPLFNHQPVHYQQGKNLGEKMLHALFTGLTQTYDKVLLMGSDCLELTPRLLQRVNTKLELNELVLIPAVDGGYVLIAAKGTINPNIFAHIDWGSDKVLIQTLERAMQSGIKTALLNPLRDIDLVEDVKHYAELQQYL